MSEQLAANDGLCQRQLAICRPLGTSWSSRLLIFVVGWWAAFAWLVLGSPASAFSQNATASREIPDWQKDPTTLVFPAFLHTYGIRKATETQLRIYTRNRVRVKDPQGIVATRLNSWDDPSSKKDDDEVTVYGVNSGYNLIIYNTSMTSLGIYGMSERGKEKLHFPRGITANPGGDVYVADTGADRVVRLFNPSRQLRFVSAIGGKGAAPGKFAKPHDVAVDSKGMLYVADTGNNRIQVFDAQDRLDHYFGTSGKADGELWRPSAIAVTDPGDPWSYYKDEFVVVVDLDGRRVQKFLPDGTFVKAVHTADLGAEDARLAYVAIDYYSNIWVTDQANDMLHKLDRKLNFLTSFGHRGTGDKEFVEPRGISIYKRFGQVLVAERNSAQYYWIGTDIKDVGAEVDSATGAISLSYFLTEPSFVSLDIEKRGEGSRTSLLEKAWRPSGRNVELTDGGGRALPEHAAAAAGSTFEQLKIPAASSGTYSLYLRIEPTYSSYHYFHKDVKLTAVVP
jgi:DNA-binding beta-propeller fold protein YncE